MKNIIFYIAICLSTDVLLGQEMFIQNTDNLKGSVKVMGKQYTTVYDNTAHRYRYFDELGKEIFLIKSEKAGFGGPFGTSFLSSWWYFDAKLDDGSIAVVYFWKINAIKDFYYIGVNYNKPDGTEYKKIKFFKSKETFFSKDSCNVKYNNNVFVGNLDSYLIKIDPKDFDGFGLDIKLDSKIDPYRPQDGIINAGEDYFAWLAAVPNGNVSGTLTYENIQNKIKGSGYHDHNWGNIELQKLFDNWLWFRGTVGQYTIIGYELNTISSRGGYSIPGIFIADSLGIIYENYGQNGIFTAKENLITDLYEKNNEPLYSKLKIITTDDFYIEIEGTEVIENLYLFDVNNIPVLPNLFQFSDIDPYYTRYKSKVKLQLPNEAILTGEGVLEIMDLK